jgi:DNA helicase-2/ATP-dependent DNA helicase PcrA
MISLDDFYRALARFRPLPDEAQRSAIEAPAAAGLFIVAGPGSGKTTCLTLRMLKLIMVDDVPPRGILATTFTVKAAEELRSRLLGWGFKMVDQLVQDKLIASKQKSKLKDLDINQVWTGTLDSLCEQLLRDYRAPGTHPPVLADEFVARTLLLRSGLLADSRYQDPDLDKWLLNLHGGSRFNYHLGTKTNLVRSLWDRRYQDLVDWSDFEKAAPRDQTAARRALTAALEAYRNELGERHMVDFALLEFEVLQRLRAGQLSDFTQELRVVLVDEYQDTNLLQEQIYFQLGRACTGAVVVVGDDDQSLYRFRGATVNLFRDFETRYQREFAKKPTAVYLAVNYRSTQRIVSFVNQFAEMDRGYQAVRVAGKPRLKHGPNAADGMPVLGMFRASLDVLANDLAGFIHQVFRGSGFAIPGHGKIVRSPDGGDVGDCALLCSSPAEYNSGNKERLPLKLRRKLVAKTPAIEVFNPRGQALSKIDLVEVFGGLLAECIDPGGAVQSSGQVFLAQDTQATLNRWRQRAIDFVEDHGSPAGLLDYAKAWALRDPGRAGYEWPRRVPAIELVYGLVHYLKELHDDPEGQVYLEVFTRQLGACEQVSGFKGVLIHDPSNTELSEKSVRDLVRDFLAPIAADMVEVDEDLIGSFPRDRLSVLSIHQSKGLEFPLTIVDVSSDYNRNHPASAFKRFPSDGGPPHRMEDLMRAHSALGKDARSQADRAFDDLIRQYFVAYSRPQEVLLLVGLDRGGPGGNIPNVAAGWTRDGISRWADRKSMPILMI